MNYPPFVAVCRICGAETWPLYKEDPNEDWELIVQSHKLEAPKWADLVPHPPDLLLRVGFHHDRLWLSHAELLTSGYDKLETGSIVLANGRFYELQGYNWLQGEWWVEEVETEGAADELYPAMFDRVEGVDE